MEWRMLGRRALINKTKMKIILGRNCIPRVSSVRSTSFPIHTD